MLLLQKKIKLFAVFCVFIKEKKEKKEKAKKLLNKCFMIVYRLLTSPYFSKFQFITFSD